ncbi:MAG: SDR family NAD(P)-dependent oxidoreductase [Saprospiraceae bacterium]|nr:SDR family NAD(P)-dependent oxidoreductase [Saprospiraceae bacterium]
MLKGKIAVVTGASRGIGRGIAQELGLAGATVVVTGRSRDDASTDGLPGTVDGAAQLVTEAGGLGVPFYCDHTQESDVTDLAKYIKETFARIDILNNNVWGGYEQYDPDIWTLPIWEQPVWRWDKMWESGVRAHYITSRALVPLMLSSELGLIINISAGDGDKYLGDIQYDVNKHAVNRLGFAMAQHRKAHRITALTVHPGSTRTERMIEFSDQETLKGTHSPRFVGRAIVALAKDPQVHDRSGGVFKVGQLGLDYNFQDVDGSQPPPFVIPESE